MADEGNPTPASEVGARRRARVQGRKAAKLQAHLERLDPGVAGWVDSFVFGQVWDRPGLGDTERTLVAIGMLAATERPDQLRAYLFGALDGGVSPAAVHEVLVMSAVYAGFPAALNALRLWHDVLRSAEAQGISVDRSGLPATSEP
ncbi:MAG TPA: carboxymuconolactone decarboxylase family protein [Mycobacterium sp.]|nr:carboxymuconolactone decarboxylase family protein [Mycobacterium sp.]